MELNTDSVRPLYEQLKGILKGEISKGVYKYGDKIPTETDLCKIYGVSRITARRAVSDLVKEDILYRQQGKGTFIKSHSITRELLSVDGFSEFVSSKGSNPHSKVISKELVEATSELSKKLNTPINVELLKLVRLLYIESEAFVLDIAHYPMNRFPNLIQYIKDSRSTYEILKNIYNVYPSTSKKLLNIVLATNEEAMLLNCEAGEPLYKFDKVAYDSEKKPVHTSVFYVVGKRATFTVNDDPSF
ncbi:GntR family transcriptional regulator [Tuberibacillus sp. Marseille-P3662]|uniref:GntR family transcriptional regulator n=1 Tax=Tuberibacillus sp. Marseille-P3662 TaxID=1965358 RepID=UPI000A1C942C|nr:GntR family transcriptional regulator [Tuberibacillus sp. Marseille-P3662]